jgi:hypothetical protein
MTPDREVKRPPDYEKISVIFPTFLSYDENFGFIFMTHLNKYR